MHPWFLILSVVDLFTDKLYFDYVHTTVKELLQICETAHK